MTTRSIVIALALAVVIAMACNDPNARYDGPRSECSTGPPRTSIPNERALDEPRNGGDPYCVARCGDVSSAHFGASGGPLPTVSALPTGACSEDGERCQMHVIELYSGACCPKDMGYTSHVVCECRAGTWICGPIGGGSGGVCVCLPDGGPVPVSDPYDGGCPPTGCPGPLDGGDGG
jgi:hypothetical protein